MILLNLGAEGPDAPQLADIYDVVLILRTEKAVQSFYKHKFTVGGEMTVAAGPVGAGVMLESGKEAVPCWSYVKSRGLCTFPSLR